MPDKLPSAFSEPEKQAKTNRISKQPKMPRLSSDRKFLEKTANPEIEREVQISMLNEDRQRRAKGEEPLLSTAIRARLEQAVKTPLPPKKETAPLSPVQALKQILDQRQMELAIAREGLHILEEAGLDTQSLSGVSEVIKISDRERPRFDRHDEPTRKIGEVPKEMVRPSISKDTTQINQAILEQQNEIETLEKEVEILNEAYQSVSEKEPKPLSEKARNLISEQIFFLSMYMRKELLDLNEPPPRKIRTEDPSHPYFAETMALKKLLTDDLAVSAKSKREAA